MSMWSAFFLSQELSAGLSEVILAKPSVIRKYHGWSPFLGASNRTAGKAQIASFPPSPPITPLLSSPRHVPAGEDWPLNFHSTF